MASTYYDILWQYKDTFQKLPKNKSAVIQKVCKVVFDNRELQGFGDIQNEDIIQLISEINKNENDYDPPEYVYLYD